MATGCLHLGPEDFLFPEEIAEIQSLRARISGMRQTSGVEHFESGRRAFGRGELGLAYGHWTRSAALIPDWHMPYIELANLHPLYDRDSGAALAAIRRAVDLFPESPRNRFLLGVALTHEGRTEEAEKAFLKAIELRPDYVEPHHRLANFYRSGGREVDAIREYEWILKQQSANASLLAILAALYEKTGRMNDAEAALKRLLSMSRDAAYAFYKLGLFYQRTNRPADAEKAFLRAESLKPAGQKRKMRPLPPSKR